MTVLILAVVMIALGWYLLWRLIAWGCEEPLVNQRRAKWFQQ